LDQPGRLHAVGELGEAAAAERDHAGQRRHWHSLSWRPADAQQDLEPRLRDPGGLLQFVDELASDERVGLDEQSPQRDPLVVEQILDRRLYPLGHAATIPDPGKYLFFGNIFLDR